MKHSTRLFFSTCAALILSGCQMIVAKTILPLDNTRPAEHGVRIERDLTLITNDGVALVADVYHPRDLEKSPTILVRIPFTNTFKNKLGTDAIGSFWAERGYTAVIQGTRGRYKSGGDFYPLLHERDDGIATLHWLAQQPWYNGRFGMWGGSAFGHTQWVVADQTDPGPSALIIQIASTDFYEMFHPGGAFSLESALFWAVRSRGARDVDPNFDDLELGFNGFPLLATDERVGHDISFFNDWATHTQRDAYWRSIDGEQRARDLQAPVLLMAGWYDPFLPTQLRDFATVRNEAKPAVATQSRLIIGPWTHADAVRFPDGTSAGDYRPASIAPSVAWFDRHLHGEPPTAHRDAPVRIFVMGDNLWRDEQEWPLARAVNTEYYLHSNGHANSAHGDGQLTPASLATNEPPDRFVYDPRNPVRSQGGAMLGPRAGMLQQNEVETRPDVLVYTTAALPHDLEVTGPVRVVLHVATDARNTDFTAKLVDVHPDGRAYNISDGILRRAYASTDPTEINIELWPTSMVFKPGHRIRLEISSSNFPRYDRNPNTGRDIATETEPVVAYQTVFHDASHMSQLILPIVPRASAVAAR